MKMSKTIMAALALTVSPVNASLDIGKPAFIYSDADSDGTADFLLYSTAVNLDKGQCNVLIHGNSANSWYFFDAYKLWAEKGQCVVMFDLPGHGLTQTITGWQWQSAGTASPLINALQSTINHYQLTDYTVVGWSLGGDIALQTFDKGLLQNIAGMALVGTPPIDLKGRNLPTSFTPNTCAQEAAVGQYNLKQNTTAQSLFLGKTFFKDCTPPSPLYPFSVLLTEHGVRPGIATSIFQGQVSDEIDILGKIDVPVFFGYGAEDVWANPAYMTEMVNGGYFNTEVTHFVFPDSGHAVATEKPQAFIDAIDTWKATF